MNEGRERRTDDGKTEAIAMRNRGGEMQEGQLAGWSRRVVVCLMSILPFAVCVPLSSAQPSSPGGYSSPLAPGEGGAGSVTSRRGGRGAALGGPGRAACQ